ncbi:hypothetical protein TYRP_020111 [Tyrophagus putrescentiae]|nr:hypothetical protein TYRP_020111 [Tyrophagus putrescentiae]
MKSCLEAIKNAVNLSSDIHWPMDVQQILRILNGSSKSNSFGCEQTSKNIGRDYWQTLKASHSEDKGSHLPCTTMQAN